LHVEDGCHRTLYEKELDYGHGSQTYGGQVKIDQLKEKADKVRADVRKDVLKYENRFGRING
jgi:hypothetical protein